MGISFVTAEEIEMIDRGSNFPSTGNRWSQASVNDSAARGAAVATREAISRLVADDLLAVEQLIGDSVASQHACVNDLSSQAAAMGGKRLRPVLVMLSARATKQPRSPLRQADMLSISAAVELVHAASLVHDDVMDHATERRHLPTVGQVAGNSAAILLGDYLFTKAYGLAASCRSSLPARQIARAATELCEGELRQQMSSGNWCMSLREYRDILVQKTGSLCGTSCRLGGWVGGADRAQQRALERFGRNMGLAFQLFDDWLDYWGTDDVGKTLGSDFRQAKPTLPTLRLLDTCSAASRGELLSVLSSVQSLPFQESFAQIRTLLDQSDASEFTLRKARTFAERAIDSLDVLPESPSKDCLESVARFSVARAA